MKNIKKYLSLFLILTTILSSITVFYINAAQTVDEITVETENVVIEHELVPMMANMCVPVYYTIDLSNNQLVKLEAWESPIDYLYGGHDIYTEHYLDALSIAQDIGVDDLTPQTHTPTESNPYQYLHFNYYPQGGRSLHICYGKVNSYY